MTNYIERYWRDAKPADAIKEPPMVARFRDMESDQWYIDVVCGTDTSRGYWFSKDDGMPNTFWWRCQVYDAPDPGEGWRLIDTDSETKREGDEYLHPDGMWYMADSGLFRCKYIYRRRITPAVTYEPFTWEDREQLRGKWIVQVESTGTEQMVNKLDLINGDLFANNKLALELLTGWRFLDTGEPVGKKVTQ